jgi:pimeloyl-ACP methyl ester carboxylesterase
MTTKALIAEPDTIRTGVGQPLVLAHGAGGGVVANFGAVMSALASERTLIGVNYPGSGLTPSAREPLSLEVLADSVVQSGLDAGFAHFPILGLSLGTAVAVTAALRHPDVVSGLLLTVGLAKPDQQTMLCIEVWHALARTDRRALAAFLVGLSSPTTLREQDAESTAQLVEQTMQNYPEGGVDQTALVAKIDISATLQGVRVPTIVFSAGEDRIVLPETTRQLAKGIAGAELIEYPEAGHIFTVPESDTWIADIRAFLRRHSL